MNKSRPGAARRSDGHSAWHTRPEQLARFVTDLVADEAALLRPGGAGLPAPPWPAETRVDESGLGLDSLERLSVASALNEALHLHESGVEDLLLARRHFGDWLQVAARGLAHFDARLSFRTSGSSGTPKACSHALATLEQEVEHLATLTSGSRRLLCAVPAHHIYGFLFSVLLPARLGGLEVLDVRRSTPQALRSLLRAGDLLVSHPAHWALIARHVAALPAGVLGVSSTAPCPDDLAQALEQRGLARLLQVYGSSETAGVGWREAAGSCYRPMPFWSCATGSDASTLQRRWPDGSLHEHRLPDRLCWQEDGGFTLAGRLDEALQVGGINVFPGRVRQVLLEHAQVQDAAVRLMAAHEGNRLKAFIVPRAGADRGALAGDLEAWLSTRLSAPERPKAFTLGDSLPCSERGKAADWPLPGRGNQAKPA